MWFGQSPEELNRPAREDLVLKQPVPGTTHQLVLAPRSGEPTTLPWPQEVQEARWGRRAAPAYLPGCPWACAGLPPRTRPGTIRCDHGRCLPRSPLRQCSELETKTRTALAGGAGLGGRGRGARRDRGCHAVGHACQLTTRPSAMNQGTWQSVPRKGSGSGGALHYPPVLSPLGTECEHRTYWHLCILHYKSRGHFVPSLGLTETEECSLQVPTTNYFRGNSVGVGSGQAISQGRKNDEVVSAPIQAGVWLPRIFSSCLRKENSQQETEKQ